MDPTKKLSHDVSRDPSLATRRNENGIEDPLRVT